MLGLGGGLSRPISSLGLIRRRLSGVLRLSGLSAVHPSTVSIVGHMLHRSDVGRLCLLFNSILSILSLLLHCFLSVRLECNLASWVFVLLVQRLAERHVVFVGLCGNSTGCHVWFTQGTQVLCCLSDYQITKQKGFVVERCFGNGKKTHLFVTNKKLTLYLIRTNVYTKNKIKTPNHLITQPNQPNSRHLPPPPARLRRADAAAHRPLRQLSDQKKKKIRPLGVAAIHPYGQGREIQPPLVTLFVSGEPKQKSGEQKKKIGQPTKSFLMPQKSILMQQNSFLMPQN